MPRHPQETADYWAPRPRTMDDEGVPPSDQRMRDSWEELVSAVSTPGHQPYTIKHPSGLVGQHMGTHLSVYTKQGTLVGRVLFDHTPARNRRSGWPDQMDAIEALDDTARRLPGFIPNR